MANIYVRSTDGSNSDNGSTWALAKLDIAGAAAIDSAGDTIYVSQAHAESTGTTVTWNLAGTVASPTKVLCGNDGAEPPTSLATTGAVTTTGGANIAVNGHAYIYGLVFTTNSGSPGGIIMCNSAGDIQTYEDCDFISSSSGSTRFYTANTLTPPGTATWINCRMKFNATGQRIYPAGNFFWRGGSIISGGTTPTYVFTLNVQSGRSGIWLISGVDFSNLSSTVSFVDVASNQSSGVFKLVNCKLPSSWSGSLTSGAPTSGTIRVEMWNCDAADTNYRLWIEDYAGSIKHETTIVRTGGASDGTTTHSWKMATSSSAEYPLHILRSPEVVRWNDTTGSSITVTVEIVHDSQGSGTSSAFTDKEIWLEVQYLGTSGFPLSLFVDDAAADVLASAADQTSSSETWTTTGLSTPVKQKLSVSFTPQEKGYIHAVVCMAGASDTCYVDPLLTVS